MRDCLRHSKLELRGSRNNLRSCPQSSGGRALCHYFAQVPNPPTKRAGGRAGGASRGGGPRR
eukprot:15442086-Alexandrium_andersonii.AAC.1